MARFFSFVDGVKYYLQEIDYKNQKLKFTKDENKAYIREGGFYSKSELNFIKRHFSNKYPKKVPDLQIEPSNSWED